MLLIIDVDNRIEWIDFFNHSWFYSEIKQNNDNNKNNTKSLFTLELLKNKNKINNNDTIYIKESKKHNNDTIYIEESNDHNNDTIYIEKSNNIIIPNKKLDTLLMDNYVDKFIDKTNKNYIQNDGTLNNFEIINKDYLYIGSMPVEKKIQQPNKNIPTCSTSFFQSSISYISSSLKYFMN
jgi:hypothetical protein